MKTLTNVSLWVILAVFCLNTITAAQPPIPGEPIRPGLRAIGLTPEQIQKVRQIIQENRHQLARARDASQAARQVFRAALESADQQQIRAAGAVLGNAITEHAIVRAKVDSAIKEVLTPDQWNRLQALRRRARQAQAGPARPIRAQVGPTSGPPFGQGLGPQQPQGPAIPGGLDALQDRQIWRMVDRDSDGAITQQELKAYLKEMRARPRPGRPQ